jgi:formylglycine-generating enzyme required for sulfatase activity
VFVIAAAAVYRTYRPASERDSASPAAQARTELLASSTVLVAPKKVPRTPAKPRGPVPKTPEETEITNSIGMKLILIPAGEFLMGSSADDVDEVRRVSPVYPKAWFDEEQPQHRVKITAWYYIGRTEVTQGQWRQVNDVEPWKGDQFVRTGDDFPASCVTWYDAVNFCKALTAKEREAGKLPAGQIYTLPTEAEWEYACRAGTHTNFCFGNDESRLGDYAWFGGRNGTGNIAADNYHAHRVAQKLPNAWGIYDMHGNLWEWCEDWLADDFYADSPSEDPEGFESGEARVWRGGNFLHNPVECRSAERNGIWPNIQGNGGGFRIVLRPDREL